MRKRMVAGNWKMNGARGQAQSLVTAIKEGAQAISGVDIVIFPSLVHLALTESLLRDTAIAWGSQNLHPGVSGAFTGEVSGSMLKDYGCQYVLIGHSERRALFHEDLQVINAKFQAALDAKLTPILCVGETLAEREQGKTEQIISSQLESVIKASGIETFHQAVIAYEPVWAIGTGLTATPEQAQNVHAFIRGLLAKHDLTLANATCVLYGGSVKADNASGLFSMPDIDGALVGGASLEAQSFLGICRAAAKKE